MWGVELMESRSVAMCGVASRSNVDGRGTTAAEKQQSLQSLICKYANERVIKIGRLSVALWLLMNSNLQEKGGGEDELKNEKELDAIVLLLIRKTKSSEYRTWRPYLTKENTLH